MARITRDDISRFLDHDVDVGSKTIYFGYGDPDGDCDLDHILAANVIKSLHILSSIRPDEPIRIIINNTGGDDTHGLGIYDMIRSSKSPVHGYVYGNCQSMAVWVLQACDHRAMSKHSTMMIHDGEGVMAGKKEDVDTWKKWQDKQDEICRDILLDRIREKHPKFQRAKLIRMLSKDTPLSATEALGLGLIDEVIEESV